MSLTDVIFYENKLALKNVIDGYKNIVNVPNVGERVVIHEIHYKVMDRTFDFDGNVIHIVLEKVNTRFKY